MRNLFLVIVFLFNSSFIVGQIGSCGNRINTVTFSPVAGTNDITVSINSDCCEVHGLDGYQYTNNAPNHTLRLCYLDTGLLMPTNITANIVLSNVNATSGTQNFTINSYYRWGNLDIGCLANTVFHPSMTLSFDAPLLQPRVFTLANNEFEAIKLNLYPNPNNGAFSIDLPTSSDKVQLTIFDISGKEVHTNFSYSSGDLITLEKLSSGLYFAKVVSGESTETLKFVIK